MSTPLANAAPRFDCPHCGEDKPPHFFTCAACTRETPRELRITLCTCEANLRTVAKRETLSPFITETEARARLARAEAAILAHLRLNSSAL
jgi:hypothetical protein